MAAIIKVILKGKLEKKKKHTSRHALLSKSAVKGGRWQRAGTVGSARPGVGRQGCPDRPGGPRAHLGSLGTPRLTPTSTPLSSVQLGK